MERGRLFRIFLVCSSLSERDGDLAPTDKTEITDTGVYQGVESWLDAIP